MTLSTDCPAGRRAAYPCLLALCSALGLASCAKSPSQPDPAAPASLAVSLTVGSGAAGHAGPAEAFDLTDAIQIRLIASSETSVVDTVLPFEPLDPVSEVFLNVPLETGSESLLLAIELRRGFDGVFRGLVPVVVTAGTATAVEVPLAPIPAGVRAPEALPPIPALNDTILLEGAVIFATADTIPGLRPTWSSPDEAVSVSPDGVLVSVAEGQSRVVATFQQFTDTVTVTVQPVVAQVVVEPALATINIQETLQYTARTFDASGNEIFGRQVTWSSDDPAVAVIDDATGLAMGVESGTTVIRALSEGVEGTADLTVAP